ncbi:MAG: formylglycine-generating enzyme family protein [Nitrospirota bacterium]
MRGRGGEGATRRESDQYRFALLIATYFVLSCSSLPLPPSPPPPIAPAGMVLIPAGAFTMGTSPTPTLAWFEQGVDETPQRRVKLDAFWIDRYEVTEGDYAKFIAATGHRAPRMWPEGRPSRTDHPVVDVSWDDADAYCRWAGKRLPTEMEWEKAARGDDGRIWPWGNEYQRGAAVLQDTANGDTAAVGSRTADVSPYGVYDMAGNAMEWTASWYEKYPGSTLERLDFGQKYRVLKGGAWTTPPLPFSRAANRHAIAPFWDHPHFGFRCVK